MPTDLHQEIVDNFADAAAQVTLTALQHQKPLCFAAMQSSDSSEVQALVVIALNAEEAQALMAFCQTRGVDTLLPRREDS